MIILISFISVAFSTVLGGDTCKYGITETVHQKYNDGKCYVFFQNDYERYSTARDVCRKYRGFLTMPKTKTINDLLTTELANIGAVNGDRFWIGLNDKRQENVFVWEDGTRLHKSNFNSWGQGEGRVDGILHHADDCVALDKRGSWHDYICKYYVLEKKLPFVCEFSVPRRTTTMKP